jgi:hypothetical protein
LQFTERGILWEIIAEKKVAMFAGQKLQRTEPNATFFWKTRKLLALANISETMQVALATKRKAPEMIAILIFANKH